VFMIFGSPAWLRKWIVQAQVDGGDRPGPSSEELAEIKALKSQVRDLTEADEMGDLKWSAHRYL
jgi:transposase